jgi:hypothetical protein
MTVTAISLADAVSGVTVPILPRDGVSAQVLDVAAPARAVEEDRVNAHGSYDTTRYLSAAAVSLSMLLWPGASGQAAEEFLDELGQLLSPSLRPALVVSNDAWAQDRQLTVRYDSIAKPLSDPTNWPVQVSWKAPAGTWEDAGGTSVFVQAFIASSTGLTWGSSGMAWTVAGAVWPATSAPSPSQVTSDGNTASQWTALLYGPCAGPKLANDTDGLTLEFTDDLTLAAGEFVLLDSAAQTAYRNGDPNQPVTGNLNFTTSAWWLIQPGANTIRYYPTGAGAGSQAQLSFRSAWLA